MSDPLARLEARACLVRRVALAAIVPPLGCHLAAPWIGFDAASFVTVAEVVAAVSLRLAGVPLGSIRIRTRPRRRPVVAVPQAVAAVAS